jgi:hypothetical protein
MRALRAPAISISLIAAHERQRVYKPGSVHRLRGWATIPLGRRLRAASSNQPGRRVGTHPYAAPIRSCSRWGLPCRRCYQKRGALLPHPFTLTSRRTGLAVCSLWHCPWGHPRRALPATVVPRSPDFPRVLAHPRPPDPLAGDDLKQAEQTAYPLRGLSRALRLRTSPALSVSRYSGGSVYLIRSS